MSEKSTKTVAGDSREKMSHPMERYLRMERIPHIWCAGCSIGIAVNAFCHAVQEAGLDQEKVAVVSGIGCTGRAAGYLRFDSFHTTHGRAIPFATGLKLANPELTVVVISGDGDLISIGGNHFIHAARRNVDINVICVNNFIYGMTGGQVSPTTPLSAHTSTTPYGNFEPPFNLPYLALSSGAVYVARWTALHVRRMKRSMVEALRKSGFCFIEIVGPCPTIYVRRNRLGTSLDIMKDFRERSVVRHGADPKEADLTMTGPVLCGKFADIEKETFTEVVRRNLEAAQ